MSLKHRLPILLLVCVAALIVGACDTDSGTPTEPTSTPAPAPPPSNPPPSDPPPAPNPQPAPPPPAGPARVEITVDPNPVPFSGQPINDVSGCVGVANTWFYQLVLRETGGREITFTEKTDQFDGRVVNDRRSVSVTVPANGTVSVQQRWCSSTAGAHTAQTSYAGQDTAGNVLTITSAIINLTAPPGGLAAAPGVAPMSRVHGPDAR